MSLSGEEPSTAMSLSGEDPKPAGEKCSADELRTLFLFEALTDEQLRTLCENGRVVTFQPGPVCTEGDPATCFYVMIEGELVMSKLSEHVNVPLASGECNYMRHEFRKILALQALDIIQPDICLCGGILEMKKIAAMAEAHYVMVAPHNPMGPVSTAVSATASSNW